MISYFSPGPSILMYHSIADNSNDPYAISVDAFREQMSWISEHGFEVLSLSSLLRSIQTQNYDTLHNKVVITFDDGCEDFVINALPILMGHKATATVFLVTEMLEGRSSWNEFGEHVRLMSWDEARYIKKQGISLGSHTATHKNLTLLDEEDLKRQLRDSHDALTRLGESFYAFSYPWGQWSPQVVEATKAAGYECAVVAGGLLGLKDVNPYLLPRITIRRELYLKRFSSLLRRSRTEVELRKKYRVVLDKIRIP